MAHGRKLAALGAAALLLDAGGGGAAERADGVLAKGICVPGLGTHVVVVGGAVDGCVEAVVVARLLVATGVVLGRVQALGRQLAVCVELTGGLAVEGLRLVAVRAGRPRRGRVVGRIHGVGGQREGGRLRGRGGWKIN